MLPYPDLGPKPSTRLALEALEVLPHLVQPSFEDESSDVIVAGAYQPREAIKAAGTDL
jgi:hypothetical protein